MSEAMFPEPVCAALHRRGAIGDIVAEQTGRSGASVWRVSSDAGDYCVRRWPRSSDRQRLDEIFRFMRQVRAEGVKEVPAIIDDEGLPFRDRAGCWWSVETWAIGEAAALESPAASIFDGGVAGNGLLDVSPQRVQSAVALLAGVHRASRKLGKWQEVPFAVRSRVARLEKVPADLMRLGGRVAGRTELERACGQVGHHCAAHYDGLRRDLNRRASERRECHWVVRDIHRFHVLFQGESATGFIDFDAVRIDTPATDLARLLGSMVRDRDAIFAGGIESYLSILVEADVDLSLVDILDHATTLCAAVYWIDLLVENDDKLGWRLLRWHLQRLARFSSG